MHPRRSPADDFFRNSLDRYGTFLMTETASEINAYRNFLSIRETGSTINLCTLDQNELDVLYGSAVKNLHWISRDERK